MGIGFGGADLARDPLLKLTVGGRLVLALSGGASSSVAFLLLG